MARATLETRPEEEPAGGEPAREAGNRGRRRRGRVGEEVSQGGGAGEKEDAGEQVRA